MDIFGLTPVDAALAALGLNCSQKFTEFLFLQTLVGPVALSIGFLWSLWQSVQEGSFKYFVIFVFISLTFFLLFITPKHQEPTVKSAVEIYGLTTVTAKSIKDAQTTDKTMPTILSFIGQMADMVNLGVIRGLDQVLNQKLRFLSNPFGPQKLSLEADTFLHAPLADLHLQEELDSFIYAHYLPSLIMYKNATNHLNDPHTLWPGDERILPYYSFVEKKQWESLQDNLKHLINDPQGPWIKVKELLGLILNQQEGLDDQIMASFIRAQLQGSEGRLWWHVAGVVQTVFPYLMGCANFCLYVTFPLLMLAIVVIRRMSLFLRYTEVFLWIKSLYLTSAISYYISIVTVRVQAQTQSQANWFWDYPYYSLIASILLCLMPILSWCAIHQGFQLVNNRS